MNQSQRSFGFFSSSSWIACSNTFLLFLFISFSPLQFPNGFYHHFLLVFLKEWKYVLTADSSVFIALMWLAKAFYQFEFSPGPGNGRGKKNERWNNRPPDANSIFYSQWLKIIREGNFFFPVRQLFLPTGAYKMGIPSISLASFLFFF